MKRYFRIALNIVLSLFLMINSGIEIKAENIYDTINVFNHINEIDISYDLNKDKEYTLNSNKNHLKDIRLIPLGIPVGLKINTKGVLVIAISDITAMDNTKTSPAVRAGIQIGDIITSVNNIEVNTGEELSYYINNSNGNRVLLTVIRNDKPLYLEVTPVQHVKDLKYKIGLWVRDYTSGVGMITFVQKDTRIFGALGHPITDVDTDQLISVLKGDVVSATIVNIKKGTRGYPGELKGQFKDDCIFGRIDKNTRFGVFGTIYDNNDILNKAEYPIALKNEVVEGSAKIITTIDGYTPKEYSINIEKILNSQDLSGKNMLIRITDEELISKTEGIVQGMSGSPILQNGKIIGAVTHVLLNKPNIGYGIYVESMLQESGIIK